MPATDKYVNQAFLSVLESAANTLTFKKLETGSSIHEKVGWLLSRMDYNVDVLGANFGAENDAYLYGIAVSDQFTAVSYENNAIIDLNIVKRTDFGTAASAVIRQMPHTKTFADLPGGGIIIPPNPIYIFGMGENLTSALLVEARMFYTVHSLKTEDFWELVEARRMIGT